MATKTLKMKGTFGGGKGNITSLEFACETCFGEFDIEIPFESPVQGADAPATSPVSLAAQFQDMGEVKESTITQRKVHLSAKP